MAKQHPFDRTLRWMRENLEGAYNARHPPGHENAGKPCTNSGTCLIACCYINALGKALLKGGPSKRTRGPDFIRFREFLTVCMPDFVQESNRHTWPVDRNAAPREGTRWLYDSYRCGFVHQAYPTRGKAPWGRSGNAGEYWSVSQRGYLYLNIDGLVSGFLRGVEAFRARVEQDPDLREHFVEYLEAE